MLVVLLELFRTIPPLRTLRLAAALSANTPPPPVTSMIPETSTSGFPAPLLMVKVDSTVRVPPLLTVIPSIVFEPFMFTVWPLAIVIVSPEPGVPLGVQVVVVVQAPLAALVYAVAHAGVLIIASSTSDTPPARRTDRANRHGVG